MRAYGRVGGESGAEADKASGAFSGIDFDEGLSGSGEGQYYGFRKNLD